MKKQILGLIMMYQRYINNVDWHVKNNMPTEPEKIYLAQRKKDFEEIITHLKTLIDENK